MSVLWQARPEKNIYLLYWPFMWGIFTSHWKGLNKAKASLSLEGAWVTNAPLSAKVTKENSTNLDLSYVRATSPINRSAS